MPENNDNRENEEINNLYPDLSTEELDAAEENLTRYLATVLRICEHDEFQSSHEDSS